MTEGQALEEIRLALAKFRADETSIPELRDESVYDELVKQWAERRGPPPVVDVSDALGIPTSTLGEALKRLEAAGRVRKISRGVWLPL